MLKTTPAERRGFTLVEILVVITIVGALMTFGYQLLKTFMAEKLTTSGNISLESLFKGAREKALGQGKILSLKVNLETEQMGLMEFDPALELGSDPALSVLAEVQRRKRGLSEEDSQDGEDKPKEKWLFTPRAYPIGIRKFYAPSGVELPGPVIFIHFYPDGTSDSILIELKRSEKAFLFLPRYNVPARYFSNLPVGANTLESDSFLPSNVP